MADKKATADLLKKLKEILEVKALRLAIIKEELRTLIQKYATPRRTQDSLSG